MQVVPIEKRRKRHFPTPSDLLPLQKHYVDTNSEPTDEDIDYMLDRYSNDEQVDLYTLSDVLNISRYQLDNILRSEKWSSKYQIAKASRGDMLAQLGLQVAGVPYHKIMNGENIPAVLVKACANYSNYMFTYAKSLNSDLNPIKPESNSGSVNIQINLPQFNNLDNKEAIDIKPDKDNE